jgi:hypothetical protein
MQPSKNKCDSTIEYIGGPFDGHLQNYIFPSSRLPCDVVWLVTSDAFQQINTHCQAVRSVGGRLTSAAVYELDTVSEPSVYRHVGSISANCFRTLLQKFPQNPNRD